MGKAVEKKNEWLTAGRKGDQMFIGRHSKGVAVLAGWIVLSPILVSAQKAIIIDDDLSANADVLIRHRPRRPIIVVESIEIRQISS